jgi:DNA-binding NtrC family response regulator
MLDRQQFRQDLLYRINTVEIHLPSLRERPEDIPILVRHYLEKFGKKYNKLDLHIEPAKLERLMEYRWPGNVRELVHAVERAIIMADGSALSLDELLVQRRHLPAAAETERDFNLDAVEKRVIQQALVKHGGNMSKAAHELGLGRTTLYRKIAKHGL